MQFFAGINPGLGMPGRATVQPSHTGHLTIHGLNNVESECTQQKPRRSSPVKQALVSKLSVVPPGVCMALMADQYNAKGDPCCRPFHRLADIASPRYIPQIDISDDGDPEHEFSSMIRDFIEKSSGTSHSANHSSDDESPSDNVDDAHEVLQDILTNCTLAEKDLASQVKSFFSSITEEELSACHVSRYCQGRCIYVLLSQHLRSSGYNAAVCKSKWPKSGKTPGGEHIYVDVIFDRESQIQDRLIIDIDFCGEFQIARPTLSYAAATKALPLVFVGSSTKLSKILPVMAKEARQSLERNAMPFPPWRTLGYMTSKWKAPFSERQTVLNAKQRDCDRPSAPYHCVERLRQLNLSMGV